jgi:hypothetical protein
MTWQNKFSDVVPSMPIIKYLKLDYYKLEWMKFLVCSLASVVKKLHLNSTIQGSYIYIGVEISLIHTCDINWVTMRAINLCWKQKERKTKICSLQYFLQIANSTYIKVSRFFPYLHWRLNISSWCVCKEVPYEPTGN